MLDLDSLHFGPGLEMNNCSHNKRAIIRSAHEEGRFCDSHSPDSIAGVELILDRMYVFPGKSWIVIQ